MFSISISLCGESCFSISSEVDFLTTTGPSFDVLIPPDISAPSRQALEIILEINEIDLIASSLPGIT